MLTLERWSQNEVPKTIKIDLNGVQVAPFGPKLGQNDAPDLRIIFQTLLGPKTSFQHQKNTKITTKTKFYR